MLLISASYNYKEISRTNHSYSIKMMKHFYDLKVIKSKFFCSEQS